MDNTIVEAPSTLVDAIVSLSKSRESLMSGLPSMNFNANGADTNGCQTSYKILKEQADKIDDMIKLLASKL